MEITEEDLLTSIEFEPDLSDVIKIIKYREIYVLYTDESYGIILGESGVEVYRGEITKFMKDHFDDMPAHISHFLIMAEGARLYHYSLDKIICDYSDRLEECGMQDMIDDLWRLSGYMLAHGK